MASCGLFRTSLAGICSSLAGVELAGVVSFSKEKLDGTINRTPCSEKRQSQAQLIITSRRLRKPIRLKICTATQITQAEKPWNERPQMDATAELRPITSSVPRSRYWKGTGA